MSKNNTWVSDSELVQRVGEGWVDELELCRYEIGSAEMLEAANEWLAANGHEVRVTAVQEHSSEDELEWKLA
jgi:hypothetical protein